jgi:hypothetical protein
MPTSSFLMLAAASFIPCISCSHASGFPFKYTLDFMQPHQRILMEIGQVTKGAMVQVHPFLTIDQHNEHEHEEELRHAASTGSAVLLVEHPLSTGVSDFAETPCKTLL